jgi:hypothetical protein
VSLQIYHIVLAVIMTEAIVNLVFFATILQPLRDWIIRNIPLRVAGEHLLECKICVSFWSGLLSVILVKYTMKSEIMEVILLGVAVHRLSNYLHLIYSFIRDKQFDIRVNRRI